MMRISQRSTHSTRSSTFTAITRSQFVYTYDFHCLIYLLYAFIQVIGNELENEEFHSILLSQLDNWLQQAKLMPAPITRTQTGLLYMRYKYIHDPQFTIIIDLKS